MPVIVVTAAVALRALVLAPDQVAGTKSKYFFKGLFAVRRIQWTVLRLRSLLFLQFFVVLVNAYVDQIITFLTNSFVSLQPLLCHHEHWGPGEALLPGRGHRQRPHLAAVRHPCQSCNKVHTNLSDCTKNSSSCLLGPEFSINCSNSGAFM